MDAERQEIERILQSKAFRTSEIQRNLLTYLAERSLAGESDALKEYTIGLDAFGKPSSYDPRQDSVVRVHVARLRQKLEEYYRTEGANDPVLVDLPKGGFKVVFESRTSPFAKPVHPETAAPVGTPWRRREVALAVALLAAIGSALYLGVRLSRVGRSTPRQALTPELQQLWGPLLASDRPLVVCIASRLLVRMPGVGFVRDPALDEWADVANAKTIQALREKMGVSTIYPSYGFTGAGTASGAFLLGRFLGPLRDDLVLVRSDLLSWPEIKENNVIFLGSPVGTRQMEALPEAQQIRLERDGIRVLNPRPGEPAFIPDQVPLTGNHLGEESHAVISDMPGIYGRGEILMLAGNQLTSVIGGVQAFTDPNLARMLVSRLRAPTGRMPRYYQVVLNVRARDNFPIEISYMFHHELPVAKKNPAGP